MLDCEQEIKELALKGASAEEIKEVLVKYSLLRDPQQYQVLKEGWHYLIIILSVEAMDDEDVHLLLTVSEGGYAYIIRVHPLTRTVEEAYMWCFDFEFNYK